MTAAREVTVKFTLSDQLLRDVLCVALEGGIGYWAEASDIKTIEVEVNGSPMTEYVSCTLTDAEGTDDEGNDWTHSVTLDTVAEGIRRIMSGEVRARRDIEDAIRAGVADNDAGHIDADAADVILQVALFGAITYG